MASHGTRQECSSEFEINLNSVKMRHARYILSCENLTDWTGVRGCGVWWLQFSTNIHLNSGPHGRTASGHLSDRMMAFAFYTTHPSRAANTRTSLSACRAERLAIWSHTSENWTPSFVFQLAQNRPIKRLRHREYVIGRTLIILLHWRWIRKFIPKC
jgi:hypothetical protein